MGIDAKDDTVVFLADFFKFRGTNKRLEAVSTYLETGVLSVVESR